MCSAGSSCSHMQSVQIQKYGEGRNAQCANTEIQGGYLAQIQRRGVAQVRQLPVVLQQYNTAVFLALVMRMMMIGEMSGALQRLAR